jgi:hypothetical protein
VQNKEVRNDGFVVFAFAVMIFSVPVWAHHGTAVYDASKTVTVKGTVIDFQFVNPHVLVFFDVKDGKGDVQKWQGEMTSPNHLSRSGWNKHTLKPGDEIAFVGVRAKSGAPTLWITKVVRSDGQEIPLTFAD